MLEPSRFKVSSCFPVIEFQLLSPLVQNFAECVVAEFWKPEYYVVWYEITRGNETRRCVVFRVDGAIFFFVVTMEVESAVLKIVVPELPSVFSKQKRAVRS